MNPKVSIIIATYNDSNHINFSIESILKQSFIDYEIIVIDDGSTDNTKDILNSYIKSNIITYLYQDNKGPALARNYGISVARGMYVAFIDSDDRWIDKDKLKKQIDFLDKNMDYVLVGTSGVIVNELEDEIIDYIVPENDMSIRNSILLKNPFILSSVVARNDTIKKAGLFFYKKNINAEDYNLWLRMGLLGKLFNLVQPMTLYMMREGNISSSNKKNVLKSNISFIKENINKYPNYRMALFFAYFKFFSYYLLNLLKNKKLKNNIIRFLFKKYRKIICFF